MLIFTRRRDDAIMIGDHIEVKVLRISPETVRIGIDAPSEIAVHRSEVYAQIREENRAAAEASQGATALADRVRRVTQPATHNRPSDDG